MKRAFIIHGWEGNPQEGWFPWLKTELEKHQFQVSVPQMPDTNNPRIDTWVPAIAQAVGAPDEQTYFVGHSMGCQAIARYIETLPDNVQVGGAVFVAGFFKQLTGLEESVHVQSTEKHWLEAPIDFNTIQSHLPKSVAIFSDNDPFVPMDHIPDFRDKLGSRIIIEHNKGHFSGSDGVKELPVVWQAILDLSA